jgi:hypothetical protein
MDSPSRGGEVLQGRRRWAAGLVVVALDTSPESWRGSGGVADLGGEEGRQRDRAAVARYMVARRRH